MIAIAVDIRPATEQDIPLVVAMHLRRREQYREAGDDHFDVSPDTLTRRCRHALHNPEAACLFVAVSGGAVVGAMQLLAAQSPVHDARVLAVQEFFLVEIPYRGQGIGTALLKEGERWARERGCEAIILDYHAGEDCEAWFSRQGYPTTEHWAIKRVR